MPLTDDDVREILRIIDESPLEELRLETEGFSLHVSKGATPAATVLTPPPTAAARPAPAAEITPAAGAPAAPNGSGAATIDAPMLGTFYRAEGAGEKPFVDVGSTVGPDTVVGIIEVMKMMNSIPAGVSGTIVEVLRDNAQLVEYGQPLFKVVPA
ncbi:MAG TPA: acetyl-CoA carboxylase biotin carboxyl carrier protein [Baekduia sp.]|nr:acetyl-CoA carboxylase biotin carboxyl carrier protein [Baekduia sp.]